MERMRPQQALRAPPLEYFADAATLVRERTGLVFGEARHSAFAGALATAMRRAGVRDPAVYATRLATVPPLLDDLVDEITVGETYFFREPGQCATIRDTILPALLSERPSGRPLRVWSAGCASGEEAYTLAILLREHGLELRAHVVGTDISRSALRKAARGRYTNWSLRGMSETVRDSYFTAAGGHFDLAPAVRQSVEFRHLNLAGDQYPSLTTGIWGMDLILCRNVLIYFDAPTVARVAHRLIASLGPRGWLMLGPSDPLLEDLVPCEAVLTCAGIVYRPADVQRSARAHSIPAPPPLASPIEHTPSPEAPTAAPAALSFCVADEYAGDTATDTLDVAQSILTVREIANRGDPDAAWRACAVALERHSDSAELVYIQAALLSEAERYVEAAATARRALYLDRGLVVAHMALGGALARMGDIEGARRAFRNAERILLGLSPSEIVPASDGEPAGRLGEMARAQISLLSRAAA
jgi:chemotaxis protein methyltransferase CheR